MADMVSHNPDSQRQSLGLLLSIVHESVTNLQRDSDPQYVKIMGVFWSDLENLQGDLVQVLSPYLREILISNETMYLVSHVSNGQQFRDLAVRTSSGGHKYRDLADELSTTPLQIPVPIDPGNYLMYPDFVSQLPDFVNWLRQEGAYYSSLAKSWDEQASQYLLNQINAPGRFGNTIDLHGLREREVKDVLKAQIKLVRHFSKTDHLHFITGRGKHSPQGIPRLKIQLMTLCDAMGLKYVNEANPGVVRVHLLASNYVKECADCDRRDRASVVRKEWPRVREEKQDLVDPIRREPSMVIDEPAMEIDDLVLGIEEGMMAREERLEAGRAQWAAEERDFIAERDEWGIANISYASSDMDYEMTDAP